MSEKDTRKLEQENRLLRQQIEGIQARYEEKIAELSLISELGKGLLNVHNFYRTCRFILDVVIENTIAQNCSIMLLDEKENRLFLVCAVDAGKNYFILEQGRIVSKEGLSYSFKIGEGAAGNALSNRRPVLIKDAGKSPYFTPGIETRVSIGSLLSVPLLIVDKPFGVINLSHSEKNIFGSNDIHLFNIIASFVAVALQRTLYYESLESSEAKYRELAENSNDGIAVIQDSAHMYTNRKYQKMTGFGPEELKGMPLASLMSNRDTKSDMSVISILKTGISGNRFDSQLHAKNGEKINVEVSASSILHEGREAFLIFVRDLTERIELERKLIHAQKMDAIGTLAGSVAHDLNNILSGIVSYPDLLLMQLPEDSPLRRRISIIKETGKKAAAIVQDLLNLARTGVSPTEAVDLNEVISDYLQSPEYQKLCSYHYLIKVKSHLEPDLMYISGSPFHLSKAFMNLISNASEAMPEGGLITIATENRYIHGVKKAYEDIREGEYATVTISDTGTGISGEVIEKIFEPFFTTKMPGRSGTGLGMAVVWGTVKDHGGYIDIQSDQGKGTTITLYFPALKKRIKKDKETWSIQDYMGRGEKILVVDDIQEQREIASSILSELGYSVAAVSSGEGAVEYLRNNSADLILLDMILDQEMDGLDAYRRILEINPGQKAIIVSGFSETDRVVEAKRLGASQYLSKPYTLRNLCTAIRSELDK